MSKSTPSFTPRSWNSVSEEAVCSLYSTPLQQRLGDMLSNLQPTTVLSQTPCLIDHHLTMLTETLLSVSRNIPPKAYHSSKRPGWSPTLKAASKRCKQFYRVWVEAGRPRDSNHPARASYKQSKREFRAQLRLHKKLADEDLYNSLDLEMDPHSFFQTFRRHTSFASRPATNYISVGGNNFEGPEMLEGWAQYIL